MQTFFDLVEANELEKVERYIAVNKAVLNQLDPYGYSALHIASTKGLNNMSFLLIDNGIDVNLKDKNGQTILHYTALYNQLGIAQKVLENGGNLSIEDNFGNQPLWTAVFNDKGRNDRIELIKVFIENGADVLHKNKVGKSPKDIVNIANYENLKAIVK